MRNGIEEECLNLLESIFSPLVIVWVKLYKQKVPLLDHQQTSTSLKEFQISEHRIDNKSIG